MRFLIAILSLTFSVNAFALKYSDLSASERDIVETRLREFVPKNRIAMDIAYYNLGQKVQKGTKSTDVLSRVKIESYETVEALFENVVKIYDAGGTDVVSKSRGSQRLLDLQREIRASEYLVWSLFRRVEDRAARDAYLDEVLDIESIHPLSVRLVLFEREGCVFTVSETASSCR